MSVGVMKDYKQTGVCLRKLSQIFFFHVLSTFLLLASSLMVLLDLPLLSPCSFVFLKVKDIQLSETGNQ